jgi:hypothetical protein
MPLLASALLLLTRPIGIVSSMDVLAAVARAESAPVEEIPAETAMASALR